LSKVAVIGLGKIGLTLAVQIASSGNHRVIGFDINEDVVKTVNSGHPTFSGEIGLGKLVKATVENGSLIASTDLSETISQSEIVVIVIPLVVDDLGNPLWKNIDDATAQISRYLKPGTLVIFETTLPVGTTRTRFGAILCEGSGLELERDLFLAYSPERVYSGRVFENFREYPKLLGGVGPRSAQKARDFYEKSIEFNLRSDLPRPNGVWDLGSSEAAEMAKLAETTFRDVNIGLANQFARFAETVNVDVYSVIEACNSQPFSLIHQPGVAVGGHCIPVYPHFYLQGDPSASIVSLARSVNQEMPTHIVKTLEQLVGSLDEKKVLILGLAYRAEVKENAFSGAYRLAEELKLRGAKPVLHDPMYSADELTSLGFSPFELGDSCSAAILHTAHASYLQLTSEDLLNCELLIDGRNASSSKLRSQIPTFVLGRGMDLS
jgi:UDP-N-acetyl-D-glucosamine dehydrogenase